jgi:plastocyanin
MTEDARPDLMREVRIRLPLPIVIPLGSLLLIAGLTIGFSQILINSSKDAAVALAIVMAANVLGAFTFLALRPAEARRNWAELLLVVAYPIIIGIAIAAIGIGEEEGEAAEAPAAPAAPAGATTEVTAASVAFDVDTINLKAGEETPLRFVNEDSVQHNIHILESQDGKSLFQGDLVTAGEVTYEIPPLDKGEYFFQCDVHPSMNGKVIVA